MAQVAVDSETRKRAPRAKLSLPIQGMHCASCVTAVERALKSVEGVEDASVNLATERAEIAFDPAGGGPAALAKAVERAGYQVRTERRAFAVEGMTCATCVGRVERALRGVGGVIAAEVNLAAGRAVVTAIGGSFEPSAALRAIEAAGYRASLIAEGQTVAETPAWRSFLPVGAALALSLPLVGEMIAHIAGAHGGLPWWLALALAGIVQFGFGATFYRAAFSALRHGTGNMDLLVALGTTAAFGYSVAQLIDPFGDGARYFEASALVIALVLFGRWLEARAKRRAGAALRALMSLRPETARIERDGREFELPAGEIRLGDVVIVRPGERVPADGVIVEGASELDESLVTGESLPLAKTTGGGAIAGSLNGTGLIKVRATAVGAESTLARIARAVEAAQASKPPVQKLVDRISAIFVPVVLVIALVTLIVWGLGVGDWPGGFAAAVSVLVIACPCALGLATPAALVAGTAAAARRGILIRDAAAIERSRRIDTIVFDKTGTLTMGRPAVTDVVAAPEIAEADLLALAAAVQAGSEHPLARAVARAAEARGIAVPKARLFRAKPGRGASATVDGRVVVVGKRELIEEAGVSGAALAGEAARLEAEGRTVMWLAEPGPPARLLGLIACADQLRGDAVASVASLKRHGFALVLLTGDNATTAAEIARQVGIAEVRAGVLPDDKRAEVERLRGAGRSVAMVGDGVNDAPALAAADLGIAMGSGTDVAMETAAITLMRAELGLVEEAIDLARATHRKIVENLAWAFAYNLIALPLAALGLLGPIVAGAAMAFSSVSVVGNALTLLRRPNRIRA